MPNKPPTDRPTNAELSEWLKEIENANPLTKRSAPSCKR